MPKTVVLAVTGCIAAYKSAEVVSRLKKLGYTVKVAMTKNATEFVAPLTFETLTGHEVSVDMFRKKEHFDVEHVSLAKEASVFVVCPATANVIAKLSKGIADDFVTTVALATKAPLVIVPAMNTGMYENQATAQNFEILKSRGATFVDSSVGLLACGDVGKGHIAEIDDIVETIDRILTPKRDLRGKTVLVTAGGTKEPIDPVRFIGNRSSGKMGLSIAEEAMERGAEVLFVYGSISVAPPKGAKLYPVDTTLEMRDKVMELLSDSDIIVMSAAPADYRVESVAEQKIKSEELSLKLVKNPDIAKELGKKKGEKKLVVFAAETENLMKNAREKLLKKNADLMVANDVTKEGAGFNVDTNIVTLITEKTETPLPLMSKREVAAKILDCLAETRNGL